VTFDLWYIAVCRLGVTRHGVTVAFGSTVPNTSTLSKVRIGRGTTLVRDMFSSPMVSELHARCARRNASRSSSEVSGVVGRFQPKLELPAGFYEALPHIEFKR
jgi:hypothetical protein